MNTHEIAQLEAQMDAKLDSFFGPDAPATPAPVVCSFSHYSADELGPQLKKASTKRLIAAAAAFGIALPDDIKPGHVRQWLQLRLWAKLDTRTNDELKAAIRKVFPNYDPTWIMRGGHNRTAEAKRELRGGTPTHTKDGVFDPTHMLRDQEYLDGAKLRESKYSEAGVRGDKLKAERRAALGLAKRQPFADDEVRLIRKMFDEGIKPAALSALVHGRVKKDMMWYIGTRRSYKNVSEDGAVAESLDRWMRTEDAADAAAQPMDVAVLQTETIDHVMPFVD